MAIRSVLRGFAGRPGRTAPLELDASYSAWADAVAASSGYDNEAILEKTRVALLKVKNGEKPYERDSVVFDEIEYSWPLLSGLLWAAAKNGGALDVLDFGGALGSTYFQNRDFLVSLPSVSWNVVEQPRHVEVGRQWFEDDTLHFYPTIADCVAKARPNVALLGSVLQYIEEPYSLLSSLAATSIETLIVDRTPFWKGDADRLAVQTVPPEIYSASYPSWIFSRLCFQSRLPANWEVVAKFDCSDRLSAAIEVDYEGMILVRKADLP